jgi:hypothetical protein
MQLLDLKKFRKCTIFIWNSLVENLKAKVQNCDNFDKSHNFSLCATCHPTMELMWRYHTFKHQQLGIIPVHLKTVAFSP